MDAAEAITLFERVLRDLIQSVLGTGWQQVPGIDIAKLQAKRDEEMARRVGIVVSSDLLEFTEFHELRRIIENQWERFKPALGDRDKKYFNADFSRMEGYRNPSAHSRELNDFEVHHVLGITGEYRNLIAIHRSSKDQDNMWYPVIEEVRDSFGQVFTPSGGPVRSSMRLHVGDTVDFRCTARDPQDRPVMWRLTSAFVGQPFMTSEWSTDPVTVTWNIEASHVREKQHIFIYLIGSGEYHREGTVDATAVFYYAVDPPVGYAP